MSMYRDWTLGSLYRPHFAGAVRACKAPTGVVIAAGVLLEILGIKAALSSVIRIAEPPGSRKDWLRWKSKLGGRRRGVPENKI
jgi:hypothetical protein